MGVRPDGMGRAPPPFPFPPGGGTPAGEGAGGPPPVRPERGGGTPGTAALEEARAILQRLELELLAAEQSKEDLREMGGILSGGGLGSARGPDGRPAAEDMAQATGTARAALEEANRSLEGLSPKSRAAGARRPAWLPEEPPSLASILHVPRPGRGGADAAPEGLEEVEGLLAASGDVPASGLGGGSQARGRTRPDEERAGARGAGSQPSLPGSLKRVRPERVPSPEAQEGVGEARIASGAYSPSGIYRYSPRRLKEKYGEQLSPRTGAGAGARGAAGAAPPPSTRERGLPEPAVTPGGVAGTEEARRPSALSASRAALDPPAAYDRRGQDAGRPAPGLDTERLATPRRASVDNVERPAEAGDSSIVAELEATAGGQSRREFLPTKRQAPTPARAPPVVRDRNGSRRLDESLIAPAEGLRTPERGSNGGFTHSPRRSPHSKAYNLPLLRSPVRASLSSPVRPIFVDRSRSAFLARAETFERRLHSAARMKEEVGLGLRRKLALVREGKLTLATYRSFFTSAKSESLKLSTRTGG